MLRFHCAVRGRRSRRHRDCGRRSGFAVVEMLVVVGILGVLMALLLPAVQQAREATRQVRCRSNLHQIGVAVHSFHSTHGKLPDSYWATYDILPQMGYALLYEQLKLIGKAPMSETDPPGVPVYVCPDENWIVPQSRDVNYRLNAGIGYSTQSRRGFYSTEGPHHALTLADVTDGLSSTAMYAERLQTHSARTLDRTIEQWKADPMRATFVVPNLEDDPDVARRECADTRNWKVQDDRSAILLGPYGGIARYGHAIPPNEVSCSAAFSDYAISAASNHPGGVHVLLADGGVRFFNDAVDLVVWRALGTIAGHEAVGEF